MDKWEIKRIDELGMISRGRSRHRPRDDKSLYGGKYPFVQTGDVKASEFYLRKYTQTYNEKGLSQSKLWNKGTLCITIAANIAETAILSVDACFPDSIVGFVPFDGISDVRFIKYSFDMLKKEMQLASLGATQDNFSVEKMLKFKFIIPHFTTQKRIADILSSYDDLIENNNRRIELLEKLAQELYKEWFVRFRFPNRENAKFVNGLPAGWDIKQLGDIVYIGSSKRVYLSDYVESGIPFYRSKEIIQLAEGQAISEPFYISKEKYEEFSNKFGAPQKNDILITSVGTIGESYLSDGHTFYFKDGNLTWLKTNQIPVLAMLIFCWLNTDVGKQTLIAATVGTSQSALTIENLKKVKICVPDKKVLELFNNYVASINEEKLIIQKQNQNLKKQRDLLLPRLMSGKLEV